MGATGYNRFSVSRWLKGSAVPRLPELLCLVEDVRAMSAIIASPEPSECVGLYCAQLLDLALPEHNVFAGHELPVPTKPKRA